MIFSASSWCKSGMRVLTTGSGRMLRTAQPGHWVLCNDMGTKLYLIAMLILLPAVCLSRDKSPAEQFRISERFRKTLSAFNELQIAPASNPDGEMYRAFVVPTFYHPLSVRVERDGRGYVLAAKRLSGQGGYGWGTLKDQTKRRLNEKEWQTLLNLLNETSFWTLPSEDQGFEPNEKGEVTICLDGASWTLEGISGGN